MMRPVFAVKLLASASALLALAASTAIETDTPQMDADQMTLAQQLNSDLDDYPEEHELPASELPFFRHGRQAQLTRINHDYPSTIGQRRNFRTRSGDGKRSISHGSVGVNEHAFAKALSACGEFRSCQPGQEVFIEGFSLGSYTCKLEDGSELVGPAYESQSAFCKMEQMWKLMIHDRQGQGYFHNKDFDTSFASHFRTSFEFCADTMPHDRFKKTHPVGVSMKARWHVIDNSRNYSGLFKTGAKFGVLRISEFADTDPKVKLTIPGFGFKVLRNGSCGSGNIFVMHKFDGQKSFNFFKNEWFSHLETIVSTCARFSLGAKMLESGTEHIGAMGVMHVAQFDENCNEVSEEDLHWPFAVKVQGMDIYNWSDHYEDEFYSQFRNYPARSKMFKLFAIDGLVEDGFEWKHIGNIENLSEVISSKWADERFFLKHQKFEDEIVKRPHWLDFLRKEKSTLIDDKEVVQFTAAGGVWKHPVDDELMCPFGYLFHEMREKYNIYLEDSAEVACQKMKDAGRPLDEHCTPILDESLIQ